MESKMFDGLHGNIVLICEVCKEKHYPRCKKEAPTVDELLSHLGKQTGITPELLSPHAEEKHLASCIL